MNANKKKFNIIDIVLILAVIAVIAGVAIRSGFTDKFSQKLDDGHIEYEFIINSIKETSRDRFDAGTKIYSQTTQKEIGEIISVTTRTAEAYIELPGGEIVKTYIPDRIDVMGKAKVKGNLDADGRCMLDGTTHIAAGKNIFARTSEITFMFTVEGVEFVHETDDSAPERENDVIHEDTSAELPPTAPEEPLPDEGGESVPKENDVDASKDGAIE